ncbi:MAG: O-antigen ligase family protein [Pirellulales bacterium]
MEAVIASLAIAGAVWGAIFLVRGTLLSGCLLYLFLVSCCGIELFRFDAGFVMMSIDRVFVVLLAAMYVLHRRLDKAEPKLLTPLDYVLFALVGLIAASAVFQKLTGNGLEGAPGSKTMTPVIIHMINGYLIPLVIYWVARQAKIKEPDLRKMLAAAVCFGIYLAATGLLEFFGQWELVFPKYIADPTVGLHYGRARGPMVQSVSYGLYLGACWLIALAWSERLGRWGQLGVVLLTPLFLAGLYCTHTRSVWMGAALGGLIVLWATLRGAWRVLVLGSIVTAGLLVAATNWDRIVSMQRGDNSAESTRESAQLRKSFAYVSWKMFQDRPLLGVGFGQFAREKIPYLDDRTVDLRLDPIRDWSHHNTFLSLLTEEGAIGLALFVILLLGWVARAVRLRRDRWADAAARTQAVAFLAVLGLYAFQLLFHDVTFTPLDNSLIFFLAGITAGMTSPHTPQVKLAYRTERFMAQASR